MSDTKPNQKVILYTKTGCKLCDQVKSALIRLAPDYPHQLTEVDITFDTSLLNRYQYLIPVVKIGREELRAPITVEQLRAALRPRNS